ncbi:hypothetical protein LRS37_05685 [Neobacillus sedimentimangrovi]|uniref:Uncharacterized protein n=1 Tax=Neobacillus sedimentimangrovi TaxID=2699460 RepID=A0ABS8QGH8_9BACI|nr:hypothetical protein [Neobacillus sedimentimangrovi]
MSNNPRGYKMFPIFKLDCGIHTYSFGLQ